MNFLVYLLVGIFEILLLSVTLESNYQVLKNYTFNLALETEPYSDSLGEHEVVAIITLFIG